jgi:hypothetical protein
MRRVFIPQELTTLYLVESAEIPSPLQEMFPDPKVPLGAKMPYKKL